MPGLPRNAVFPRNVKHSSAEALSVRQSIDQIDQLRNRQDCYRFAADKCLLLGSPMRSFTER
jgi:hypothetical protein